ncbi:hypothetical protein FJZ36_04980 [Candidatus Poribacteria bacterium]|nr:hypothetical protein [Candidatus Poribacteria bacterium]
MPKDEVALTDPMELSGMLGPAMTPEDIAEMTRCIVDEYVRMGLDDAEVYELFSDPNYPVTHAILRSHGEGYVREAIAEIRARWGGVWRFRTEMEPGADEIEDDIDALLEDEYIPASTISKFDWA